MAYEKINWESTTPINTTNLKKMEQEIYENSVSNIYSTGEQRIGTYLGKPLYRIVITGNIADNTTLLSNVDILVDVEGTGDINSLYRVIPYFEVYNNLNFILTVNKTPSNEVKAVVFRLGEPTTANDCNIALKYTKTTD